MYIPANVEFPKVKASDSYPLKRIFMPSGPRRESNEKINVEKIVQRINLFCCNLSKKIIRTIYMKKPKLIKYHIPVIRVTIDQKELAKFNPKIPDTIKTMR